MVWLGILVFRMRVRLQTGDPVVVPVVPLFFVKTPPGCLFFAGITPPSGVVTHHMRDLSFQSPEF